MRKLTLRGNTGNKFTIVDDEDFKSLSKYKWYVSHSLKYAYRNKWQEGKNKLVLLHKEILNNTVSQVDHINRDKLDNRKSNLRICTASENSMNKKRDLKYKSSRFHGVHLRSDKKKWAASIRVKGRLLHIGSFSNEEEAAKAYDEKALLYFGEFCILNFPYHS